MIWLTIPIVIVAFFTRGYLARLIFTTDSKEIALIFGYLTAAIFFGTIYTLISRWFYAQKDTKTPLFVSIFAIFLNIALVYMLAQPNSYGIAGLAMAQSLVAMAEVLILGTVMVIRDRQLFDRYFWSGCARIISVSGFSLVAGYIMVGIYPLGLHDRGFITLGGKLVVISAVVLGTHIGLSSLFGLEEVGPVLARLKRIILKPLRIQY